MKINTNIVSLNTQSFLRKSQASLETSMERLSSGKRINRASDDAAGLAIATRMESKIRGQEVGIRNSNDGVSLAQTAETSLGNIGNILQRMRELAVQSSNGTNNTDDRISLNKEFVQLTDEIAHISGKTTFNGVQLLDTAGTVAIQLSDVASDVMTLNSVDVTAVTMLVGTGANGGGTDVLNAANATAAMGEIDAALKTVSDQRAEYGANLNRLNFNIDNITSMQNNLSSARSRIEDADMAKEVSEMTKHKILTQSGMSMLSQANQNPQQITSLLQG